MIDPVVHMMEDSPTREQAVFIVEAIRFAIALPEFATLYGTHGVDTLRGWLDEEVAE